MLRLGKNLVATNVRATCRGSSMRDRGRDGTAGRPRMSRKRATAGAIKKHADAPAPAACVPAEQVGVRGRQQEVAQLRGVVPAAAEPQAWR
eukprot:124594-Chlamydomonas_euryale.AAC.3